MKIYILPITDKLRPRKQPFKYPSHNKDYGVEQDFFNYLKEHPELLTEDPIEASWHYLPVYWTRWHLNHDYGKTGLEELKKAVDDSILDTTKTFTICQYDDGPIIDLKNTKLFLASRKSQDGIDIPLLSSNHKLPWFKPKKRYLASFLGRISTHKIREDMAKSFSNRNDVLIEDRGKGSRYFVKKTLASYVSLCPRGYGGSSFRFYEAMSLGAVPFLVGDIDTRPFKEFIDWDRISLYCKSGDEVPAILDLISKEELLEMGGRSMRFYKDNLSYGKWCQYVIRHLESNRL